MLFKLNEQIKWRSQTRVFPSYAYPIQWIPSGDMVINECLKNEYFKSHYFNELKKNSGELCHFEIFSPKLENIQNWVIRTVKSNWLGLSMKAHSISKWHDH